MAKLTTTEYEPSSKDHVKLSTGMDMKFCMFQLNYFYIETSELNLLMSASIM